MIRPRLTPLAAGLALLLLSPATHAHRLWLVASTTVLSGTGQHIAVEGAISNDLFFPNHLSLPLAATTATSPSGKKLELLSPAEGKIRTSFELKLDETGTYRIATINDMMFLSWKEGGETRHARGTPAEMDKRDLTKLEGVELSRWISRVETVVTCGEPTPLKPTGEGIEFEFISHPNDLFHGETSTFRLLRDGKPLPETKVAVVKGDDRFRDEVGELTITSDAEGLVKVAWPSAGRFWLSAEAEQKPGEYKGKPLERGAAYFLTLDVLPQ
ncbi:DUF4198 domain-containing protein [Luteolibacter flavescens]|uniref:DUF4198 domain-containing protein n=1 Tax=Luteolibacter flavescens TaxID=1859460 RepID=A0ABT3FVC7_9BACT|nr:DUF4198 domain-containing protein [Luteolibacter flavescens]MCW1887536.1 DUF4198 domain-containing protein [Luteolibacter flavescens]